MRTCGLLVVVPLIAGCRIDFAVQPDAAPAPVIDTAPDAPPTVLTCGTQTQFSVGKPPTRMSALATADGYNVLTVDSAGDVVAFSYGFSASSLVARQSDVFVTSGTTGILGAIAMGDHTLVSVPRDDGTALIELDAGLKMVGQPATHRAWQGGAAALAQTGAGAVAFLGASTSTSDVETRLVKADGTPTGATQRVANGSETPSWPTMMPAGDDLLVVWARTTPQPSQVRTSVLGVAGGQFVTKVASTLVSPIADSSENPRGAYAARLNTYLIAWMRKTNDDQIWGSLRKADMTQLGGEFQIGTQGNFPVVAASDTDFLVAWKDDTQLYAARVSPQGTVKSLTIANASTVADWDLVVRAGQPALVWINGNADGGATLWFDPLCD